MTLYESRWRMRGASLVVVALLLCLSAFLSWPTTGSEASAYPAMTSSTHMDRGTDAPGVPDVGSYLAVALDEAEKSKNGPVKAGVLTTLLLLACVFGATFEWLLTFVRELGVFARWRVALVHPNVAALRRDTPFLGVFRL